jgi:hypothetical protein
MAQICELAQCVDKGLDEFGTSAKRAVHLILSLRTKRPFEQAVMDPAAMSQALQEVFDDSSEVVKRTIVSEISKSFPLPISPSSSRDFAQVINHVSSQISATPMRTNNDANGGPIRS